MTDSHVEQQPPALCMLKSTDVLVPLLQHIFTDTQRQMMLTGPEPPPRLVQDQSSALRWCLCGLSGSLWLMCDSRWRLMEASPPAAV